jgi:hypothetical protein
MDHHVLSTHPMNFTPNTYTEAATTHHDTPRQSHHRSLVLSILTAFGLLGISSDRGHFILVHPLLRVRSNTKKREETETKTGGRAKRRMGRS